MNSLGFYRWRDLPSGAGLALAYALLAQCVLTFFSSSGNVTLVWFPGGLGLAALLAGGLRYWPGLFLGAFAAGLLVGNSAGVSAAIALGNTLESLVAARLFLRNPRFSIALSRPRDYGWLMITGTFAAGLSALIGPAALFLAGLIPRETLAPIVIRWWMADAFGIALVTPVLLVWRQWPRGRLAPWRLLEGGCLLVLSFLCGQAVFLEWFRDSFGRIAFSYWLFLFLAWGAMRFGRHGTTLVILMTAIQALWGAARHTGPFVTEEDPTGLINYWCYMIVLSCVGLTLALSIHERERAANALRVSEERLRRYFDFGLIGMAITSAEKKWLEFNGRVCAMLGYSRDEMARLTWAELTHPDDLAADTVRFNRVLAGEIDGYSLEKRFLRKDGGIIHTAVSVHALRETDGSVDCFIKLIHDISERKQAEESQRLASLVYNNSSEGMMVTDAKGVILAVNPAFTQLTGYTAEEAVGKSPIILRSGRHTAEYYQALKDSLDATGHWRGEIWNRRKNGEIFLEELTINTIFGDDGAPVRRVALFSDITLRKQAEDKIWRQANYDALTGLPSRPMFRDRLEQEIKKADRAGTPLALMVLDLDRFKEVNDSLGHAMGDSLLQAAAERLTHSVRQTDTVARLGGDEFTIILNDIEAGEGLDRIARNILRNLAEPFPLGDERAYISISIGITLYPADATNIEQLLRNADQAMYAAKQQGRNRYRYFTAALQEAARHRTRLAQDLRLAIAAGQFQIHYQPIVELAGGPVRKAEALLRWQHPRRGLVSPAEFIPIAEEIGLIHAIGDHVFHAAVEQVMRWRINHHPDFQISINKSPVQFRDETAPHCRAWLDHFRRRGLPPASVVVEITEGLLMDANESKLLELRDAGIEIAIDDFGTGYSALSYLKKFHIDYLKIDRSFTRNLAPGSSDLALCEAIIVMAHKLGLQVIAEGVETEAQRDLLAAVGCDFGQGYLFAAPMTAEAFDTWLAAAETASRSAETSCSEVR